MLALHELGLANVAAYRVFGRRRPGGVSAIGRYRQYLGETHSSEGGATSRVQRLYRGEHPLARGVERISVCHLEFTGPHQPTARREFIPERLSTLIETHRQVTVRF